MTIYSLNFLIAALALALTVILAFTIQKHEDIKSWLYAFLRNFLGVFFIFSGVVKAIDPKGTGIKNGDYFAVFSEYVPALDPLWNFALDYALPIAMLIIIIEILLGITLILGIFKKPTLLLYAGLLIFFTFLTGFTTITGKVTDCGCFGDFLKLKPKVSFFKDIFLMVIFGIILFGSRKYLKPILSKNIALPFFAIATLLTIWFNFRNVNHLPIKDFRAYAVGTDLQKCTSMEGLDPGEKLIVYNMKNTSTGESKKMDSKEYMKSGIWKDKSWQIDGDPIEKVIREAQLPKCKDFLLVNDEGEELQEEIKATKGYMMFVAAYDLSKSKESGFKPINAAASKAVQKGIPVYGLTANQIADANKKAQGYQYLNLDAVPIKTMIRSNPGLVLLKDGIIIGKWHYNDVPTFEELKNEFGI